MGKKTVLFSVGGSLVVPKGGLDVNFLRNLNTFIRHQVEDGYSFFLVIGGGGTTRHYQRAAREVIGTEVTPEDIDWLGIHVTRLNAHLVRTIFKDIAHPRIIENYAHKLESWSEPVVVGAGWKPGWSTDYCAVTLAKDYGIQTIINLTNIDWVYDKDPKLYSDAQICESLKWEDLLKIVGSEWVPGANVPFDPIASSLAQELKLKVIIANGANFNNLENILHEREFIGTVIQ